VDVRKAQDFTIAHGKSALRSSLRRLIIEQANVDMQTAQARAADIESRLDAIPAEEERTAVEQMLRLLIEQIYQAIKGMRYRMLTNEWSYATNANNYPCRRTIFRVVFDRESASDHQPCGFCDLCQKDLNFSLSEAEVPVVDATLSAISTRVSSLLKVFDFDGILEVVDALAERDALASLQARAFYLLESAPQNQPALILAAEASARRQLFAQALGAYAEAFRLNDEAPRDLTRARRIYERVCLIDRDFALRLVDRRGSVVDTSDGRTFLRDEFRRHLPPDDRRRKIVEAIVTCDAIETDLNSDLLGHALTATRSAYKKLT
jgi:hypothetical protein